MRVKRLCAWVVTLAMIMTSLAVPSFAAEGDTSGDVYKASDAWYVPAEGSETENTYNEHTEWQWERYDNNKWQNMAKYYATKTNYGRAVPVTEGASERGAAWTTSGANDGTWNHPGVGEGWMSPFTQSGHPDWAVSKTFTAPKSGKVRLSTEDGKIYGGSTKAGDPGNRNPFIKITLNDAQIWPKNGKELRLPETETQEYVFEPVDIIIGKDDVLRFEVYNGDSSAQYGKYAYWKPVVTYLEGEADNTFEYNSMDAWPEVIEADTVLTNNDPVWRWLYKNTQSGNNYIEMSNTSTSGNAAHNEPPQKEDGTYDYGAAATANVKLFADSASNASQRNFIGKWWMRPSVATGSEPKQSPLNRLVKQFTAPGSGMVSISAKDMAGDSKIYDKGLTESNKAGAVVIVSKLDKDDKKTELWSHTFEFGKDGTDAGNPVASIDFENIIVHVNRGERLWFEVSAEKGGSAYSKQVFWTPVVTYIDTEPFALELDAEDVAFKSGDTALTSYADIIGADSFSVTANADAINTGFLKDGDTRSVTLAAVVYDGDGNIVGKGAATQTINNTSGDTVTFTIDNITLASKPANGSIKVFLVDNLKDLNPLCDIGNNPIYTTAGESSDAPKTGFRGYVKGGYIGEAVAAAIYNAGANLDAVTIDDVVYIDQTASGEHGVFDIKTPVEYDNAKQYINSQENYGTVYSNAIPVYCSQDGGLYVTGTEDNPYTFAEAVKMAEDGGTVIVKGDVTLNKNFTWSNSDKTITVKGADENSAIDITNTEIFDIHANAIFENLTIKCAQETDTNGKIAGLNKIAANGKHVIIKDSVKTSSVIGTILGGSFKASVDSTNLEIYGGNYNSILGGSHSSGGGAVHVNGDCNLTVGGNVNADVDESNWDRKTLRTATIHGGGYGGSVKGNSTLTLKDNVKAKYVYGGQNGLYSAQTEGKITVNVNGGQYMNVFAVLKNTSSATVTGNDGQSSTVAQFEPVTAELNMTDGIAEGVIGSQEMTKGDITINALGGTITRRLIAGVYNDLGTSTDYYVDGTATTYIGPEISIMPTSAPASRGINGGSRTYTNHSEESGRLIFLGGSYDKNKDKIMKKWTYPVPEAMDDCDSNHDYIVAASEGGSVSMNGDNVIAITPENGNAAWVNKALYEGATFTPASGSTTEIDFYSTGEQPKTLNVTLDAQGGSAVTVDSFMDAYVPSEGISLPDTSKEGYTFDGWYTAAASGTKVDKITKENLTDIFGSETSATLYAHWTANEYTITLDAKGGTGASSSIKGTVENLPTLPSPTKAGYTFAGWYTAETDGNLISSITTENIIDLDKTTLYARWTAIAYTVNLVVGEGTGVNSPITLTVEDVSVANFKLPAPTPPHNHSVGGWWTAQEGGTRVTTTNIKNLLLASQNNTVTFYAHYNEVGRYTVSYDAGEGTSAPEDDNIYYYGDTKSIPIPQQEPQRAGYTFVGWTVDDGDDTVYKYGTANNEYSNFEEGVGSIAFIAQWTKIEYTVTLDLQGGTGISSLQLKGSIENLPALPSGNPTKNGYTFDGWYTAATGSDEISAITEDNIDELNGTTLYAHWTAKTYTITLDLQDGEGIDVLVIEGTVEELPVLPSDKPTKDGFNFKGWFTDAKEGKAVTAESLSSAESMLELFGNSTEITLYAQYIEHGRFTVTYSAEGAENIPTDDTQYDAENDTEITIASEEPTKTGYAFAGWKTENDDTLYQAGDTYQVPENTASIIFTAQWTELDNSEYKINGYENGSVSIRKRIADEYSESVVIAAFYNVSGDESVLVKVSAVAIGSEEIGDEILKSVDEPEMYSYVKVFMWSGLNTMIPRCAAIEKQYS